MDIKDSSQEAYTCANVELEVGLHYGIDAFSEVTRDGREDATTSISKASYPEVKLNKREENEKMRYVLEDGAKFHLLSFVSKLKVSDPPTWRGGNRTNSDIMLGLYISCYMQHIIQSYLIPGHFNIIMSYMRHILHTLRKFCLVNSSS